MASVERHRCSNEAKTRKPLKFGGVPQTRQSISAASGPKVSSVVCGGTPANFNGFRVLAALLQRCRSTEANETLHDVWPSPGLVDYLYTFGGCCPVMEFLSGAKFTLRKFASSKSCTLLYWQRYCTALEQWARAKLCGIEHTVQFSRATITLGIGPHSSLVLFLAFVDYC